jgi:hypothetical protein
MGEGVRAGAPVQVHRELLGRLAQLPRRRHARVLVAAGARVDEEPLEREPRGERGVERAAQRLGRIAELPAVRRERGDALRERVARRAPRVTARAWCSTLR